MASKYALFVACGNYRDSCIPALVKPRRNAEGLAQVLANPSTYGFVVDALVIDQPRRIVQKAIERFCERHTRSDLLLIFFSGHGFKVDGELWLSMHDTERDDVRSTALEAQWLVKIMLSSQVRQQILLLDCCNAGALGRVPSSSQAVTLVGLTACDANQAAWEEQVVDLDSPYSVFSHSLIRNLGEVGRVRDRDGFVTTDELYNALDRDLGPKQTPIKLLLSGRQEGRVVLAERPYLDLSYWKPQVLEYAARMEHRLSHWRERYVPLPSEDEPVRPSARSILSRGLSDTDLIADTTTNCPVQRALNGKGHLMIWGSGGAGKTTAIEYYAWSRFVNLLHAKTIDRLPVLLNMSALVKPPAEYDRDDFVLLEDLVIQTGLDSETVSRYLQDGAIELIADGLNEIPGNTDDEVRPVLKQLESLLLGRFRIANRLVVTSRPMISPGRQLAIKNNVTIANLEPDSIVQMIDRTTQHPQSAAALKDRLAFESRGAWDDRTSILRMARLPLVVKLLVDLAEGEKPEDFLLPRTRGELFQRWVTYHVGRYESEERLRPATTAAKKLEGLGILAVFMLEQGMGNVIPKSKVYELWRDRLPRGTVDELINATVLRSYGNTSVTWWHQGIRDSCAAQHLRKMFLRGEWPAQYLADRDWDDPFVFMAGCLSATEVVRLIRQLLLDDPALEGPQDLPFLAARCYLETRNVHDLAELKEKLYQAITTAHRRTQEITGDVEQLRWFAEEGITARQSFLGNMLLGKILQIQGFHEAAVQHFEHAVALPAPSLRDEIDGLCHTGSMRRRRGEHDQAAGFLCRALSRAEETDDHNRDDLPWYELGYMFDKEGATRLALNCYELSFLAGKQSAERLRRESKDSAKYVRQMGYAHMAYGVKAALLTRSYRFDEALAVGIPALEAFKKASQRQWIRNMCNHLTLLFLHRYELLRDSSDLEQARHYFELGVAREGSFTGNAGATAHRHLREALLCLAEGDCTSARSQAEIARKAMGESQEIDETADIWHALGRVLRRQGEYVLAQEAFEKAIDCDPDAMNRWGIARALRDLADLQFYLCQRRQAVENIEAAKRLFEALESRELVTCDKVIDEALSSTIALADYEAFARKPMPRLSSLLPHQPTWWSTLSDQVRERLSEHDLESQGDNHER